MENTFTQWVEKKYLEKKGLTFQRWVEIQIKKRRWSNFFLGNILRNAELLPPISKADEDLEKIMYNVSLMNEDEQNELYEYILVQRAARESK
ncbi:MAG: hypothetical protein HN916_12850 [Anaerolineae bacterium]|jgi:hypothetical protein|nr:hypothetical protein [Anaerolineae bacterium]